MTQSRRTSWLAATVAASIALPVMSLSVAAMAADESMCGRWTSQLGANHDNAQTFNGPCANANNLEKMVDRKSDLTQGRPLGPANAEREAAAIKRYEEGKVKTSTDYKSSSPVSMFGSSSSSGSQ